ncbi:RNA polymerase sigma-70 factor, ECF subfamily [Nonomuraea solani]|uniref:RNA polymerase sigma-70 factor, ECF subfamily n=2 Tax=Nonomuraea solani TaxID=1144553 RepID=A0A1H6ESB3_9ACTN|nr:RNA polymerase sigma-70 factor, ECF subfamily [Nonomuraea solani]
MTTRRFEVRWEDVLPASPERTWDGITRQSAGWLWEIAYEPRAGGAERGLSGGGGTVTVWEPPGHFATRATRTDGHGRLLRLEEQDRSAWEQEPIAEADRLLVASLTAGPPGRFTLQAAIAALHAQAPTYAETDWPQILILYGELLRVWPSPVVALNRAVALAMVEGPEAALAEVEALERDGRLTGYRYLPATKADLLHRLGRDAEAVTAYREAPALTGNAAEQDYLTGR